MMLECVKHLLEEEESDGNLIKERVHFFYLSFNLSIKSKREGERKKARKRAIDLGGEKEIRMKRSPRETLSPTIHLQKKWNRTRVKRVCILIM